MILFDGELLPDGELDPVVEKLPDYCIRTIAKGEISAAEVIDSCGILSDRIREGTYDKLLRSVCERGRAGRRQIEEAVSFFDRKNLEYKYKTELGNFINCMSGLGLPGKEDAVLRYCTPLGILFHIAAGNAEGLPFYSVIEGLLAGNINILKLPSKDDGLSVFLLRELVKIHPGLARYIVVLDISSADLRKMKLLSNMADGIVVWGGDEAIRAVRKLADPGTRIISWGHKVSFAYAAADVSAEDLRRLARHICETNQLLCSSCQGIFVDTEDMAVVRETGLRFLALLEEASLSYPALPLEIRGKISLELYNEELECKKTVFRGKGVSVTAASDHNLEMSHMFRNCWV